MSAVLCACTDPPDPPRLNTGSPSTAPWVEWKKDADPVDRPVALVVDVPGGAMDRVVADPDVTTFLNDRFHPIFHVPAQGGQPPGTVRFYTPAGCPLTGAEMPDTPARFVDLANSVIVRPESRVGHAEALTLTCASP